MVNSKRFGGKFIVYLLASLAIFLWGFSYIWSNTLIARRISIFYFVFIRIAAAGALLAIFNLLTGSFTRIRRKHLWQFMMMSFCEPFLYFIVETYGIKLTESPTISSMVIASVPILSLASGVIIFKERMSKLNITGILLTLTGIFMVLWCKMGNGVGEHFWVGILLLCIAVIAEVTHASFTKALAAEYTPQVIVMYQSLIAAVLLLPLFLTLGMKDFDMDTYMAWDTWKPILCLAVLCSGLAFSLWAFTIKNLGVAKSSVFLAMISVVTALCATSLGQETLDGRQWWGVGVATLGIILSELNSKQAKEKLKFVKNRKKQ